MCSSSSDLQLANDISTLDTCLTSIRSRFLSDYTSLLSSSNTIGYDTCQLCSSIKPHGTLFSLLQSQFDFLTRTQIHVCTLCYYNLLDQHKQHVHQYRRPRTQCYVCHCYIDVIEREIKLLETEYLPFLLHLNDENYRQKYLYDNQRLALACDSCFYSLLFQYIDQNRTNIPIDQRTYSCQITYSNDNEHRFDHEEFFSRNLTNKID
jgi:hypothetical protein